MNAQYPQTANAGDPTQLGVKPFKPDPLALPPGNLFTRLITAKVLATLKRCRMWDVAAVMWPNDKMLQAALTLRAASTPAMTSVPGWAAELVQKIVADAVEALSSATCAVDVMRAGLVVSWDGYGAISVPALAASANGGGFVAEGLPIPVRQFSTAGVLINPHKAASISVLTREMIESSNAEALISDALVKSAAMAIDAVFFGAAAASAAAPAGIRNGIATLAASANADPFGAFFEDVSTLLNSVGQVGGRGPYYLISSVGRYGSMRTRFVTEDPNLSVLPSAAVGGDLVAVAAQAVAAAISIDPEIETVNAATLVMDTAPGDAGTMGPERSVWQTESVAVKVRWPVSWALRDPRGVAWLTPAWK
jgi:hypothetical protein